MPSVQALRLHGWALVIAGWLAFLWSQATVGPLDRFGTLRGVDFLQFYASAWFLAHGRSGELYDFQTFASQLPALVPGARDLLYLPIYPPQLALLMSPLGLASYLPALGAWTAVSVACYLGTVWQAFKRIPRVAAFRSAAWPLALGFPPLLLLVAHGQIAALALPLMLAAWVALDTRRPLLLGLALGAMAFKPTLGAFALVALVLAPSWSLAAGIVVSIAAQALLVVATLGRGPLAAYHEVLRELVHGAAGFEPKLWAMHNLRGAISLAAGSGTLAATMYIIGIALVMWLARRAWRRHNSSLARFAVLGVTGIVLNPHLYVYDLVLLLVPLACVTSWLIARAVRADRAVALAAYSLVWLPLAGPLAIYTHVQLTAPAMVLLLWLIGRADVSATSGDQLAGGVSAYT
jgi:hypothetical protein